MLSIDISTLFKRLQQSN